MYREHAIRTRRVRFISVLAAAVGGAALSFSGPAATTSAARPLVKVIADQLSSPHGLAWGPGGEILVSEAGSGGGTCFGPQICVGLTGKVVGIENGKTKTIVAGLFSVNFPGFGTVGAAGVAYSSGHIYELMGESSNQVPKQTPPDAAVAGYNQLGRLLDVTPGHKLSQVADPGDYDFAWSFQHKPQKLSKDAPDADPYGLFVDKSGIFLTDAAANTVDQVTPSGSVKVLAFVPSLPGGDRDSVPTCVARGKDGALYIGELTAFDNTAGVAKVYRWTQKSGIKVWRTGFTAISGCGFGKNGDFYVTETSTSGSGPFSDYQQGDVIEVRPDGKRRTLGLGQLYDPNGFLAGPDGSIYVANYSTLTKGAQLVRITP